MLRLLLIFVFALIYVLVPNCPVRRRHALTGALLAALLFECAKAASSSQPGACLSPPLPHGDEFRGDGIHGADMVDEPITNCLIDPVA